MSKKLILSVCLITSWITGFSQSNVSADTVKLKEVVITASKVPTPLRETAKPVQIISKEEIERSSGKDLAQLLSDQVGLVVNGANSNPSKNKSVFLRGAGSEYTLILIDGQPVNDPSGVGGVFDLRLLPLDQIERIEILKGSQSTLYGTDAIAGVINIITRRSGQKPFGAYGTLGYGSFNTFKGVAGIHGKTGVFDYNASYIRNTSDGITEALDENNIGNFDKDGFSQNAVQVNLGIQASDQIILKPFIRYTDFDGDFDADAFTDGANQYTSELINPGLQATFDFDKLKINSAYGYTSTDRNFSTSFGESEFRGRLHNADIFASYAVQQYITLLAGINYQRAQMLDDASTIKDPSTNIFSPYLTLLLHNLNGFNAELGYRFNNHSKYGNNATFSLAPSYQLNEHIKFFTAYSTGFKAPTLAQLYGAFGANENLDPQKSKSFEIGIQSFWLNDRLSAQVSYFSRNVENIIVFDFTNGYQNQDEQDDHGIEIDASYQVNEQLTLKGQYAYVDGEFITKDGSGQEQSFFNLIRRPNNQFSFTLEYRPFSDLFISAGMTHSDDRLDYFWNPDNGFAREEVNLDAFTLFNLYVDYKLLEGKLTVFTDLKNISDEDYVETYGFTAQGFNIQSGVRFKL
ncbi:TonB-dependent receptor [Fulvivirgaceae bacterium BMA10]|uniref:TonB-dependent receptor n=1 Tax=Splendidivirga corallicola TaxID=3051826 RepID=A0ABT8KTM0_9BACT|nr:TonB-dependent receptor [Fulvivirgaceae bacterium BMA10]